MQIAEAILHSIQKKKSTTTGFVKPRTELLPLDDVLKELTENVQAKYTRDYNQHGSFGQDPTLHPFPVLLRNYINKTIDLVALSTSTSALICTEMNKKPLTTTGFVKFLRYTDQGRDWLLILMLKTKAKAGINESTLELTQSFIFDVEHLHEAARVDLQKFQSNQTPYLTFVKPRSGKDDPGQFFRDALSCTDYVDSRHNTQAVLEALDSYATEKAWTAEQKQNARQKLYEYCKEKSDLGEPVNLVALSASINDQDPDEFRNHIKEKDFQVSDSFSPHGSTYKKLRRIAKKFGHVSLAFDVEDIISKRVELVDNTDGTFHVKIKDIPQALVDEIKKANGQ